MEIAVLGPLTVKAGSGEVIPTAAKPRKLLAMLAIHADDVVPIVELNEELWGNDIPRSASTTLQTYILNLRTLIASAMGSSSAQAKQILSTRPGGYALNTTSVDVRDFERLTEAGHRAHQAREYELAADHFRQALALWRGPALVDVQLGPLLEGEVQRLTEARLCALDRRIDADLRLGRHHELIGELTGLVAKHRTHEGLHAHLMVALYRSGRRAQAMTVYRKMRTSLIDELGLEPSPSLRRLQQAILKSDVALGESRLERVGVSLPG
ncbi:AfsR/SARP family transcriptional regulator [Kibdelosporangium philippinense]|uniref:AfsR/SARP family transcriptional regulator n=2 Tax=Kibdelosporangium philippinense TaxID=211113 RepID=A0ABS8ZEK1_9PSEU|nr:AfsR/SARP family transcriptional regulator [Kibdelosporangium philippinense]MCE7006200.1 AfsR/SARP family transcriptional regulator [Kibdelosporangium philippinense]